MHHVKRQGFTIVELLIVIVVIAILATITVLAYNGITRQATAAGMQSDLEGTATHIESYSLNNKHYPGSLDTGLKVESSGNTISYTSGQGGYCASITTSKYTDLVFHITESNKIESGPCPVSIVQMAASDNASYVLNSHGTVYVWGYNGQGRLGLGNTTNTSTPTAIPRSSFNNKTIVQIAAGDAHAAALADDGTVFTWGGNGQGPLGDGTTTQKTSPIALPASAFSNKTITKITAGWSHTLALASDGTVFAWGRGDKGQIGNNTTTMTNTSPIALSAASFGGKTVRTFGTTSGLNSFIITTDGTVYGWGQNTHGELGIGTTADRTTPSAIPAASFDNKPVAQIAGSSYRTLGRTTDGSVYIWAQIALSENGEVVTQSSTTPTLIDRSNFGGNAIADIAAGISHNLALATDGSLYIWGQNNMAQFGNGSTTHSTAVFAMPASSHGNTVLGKVIAGGSYSLAATTSSRLYAWGYNYYGQLGDGSTATRSTPVLLTATFDQ